jgi:hypothetical protein
LVAAASGLDAETRTLVDRFISAAATAPSPDEFEATVQPLDSATAEACGLPIVGDLGSIAAILDELRCWRATGSTYPAYDRTGCADD